jgi:hypothetical protein
MSSRSSPDPESQQRLLRIIKALTNMPAQMLFYGSALLAIAATGGAALPGVLGTLATTVGMNVLANMLERVARGDKISDVEIRETVENAIHTSGIEQLVTSAEFQRAIAHVFRQFDLLEYAVQKGEFVIVDKLTDQFTQHKVILDELQSELSIVRGQMTTLSTREQSAEILRIVQRIAEKIDNQIPFNDVRSADSGIQRLRIFLASPSDVSEERNRVKKVVDELNEPGGLAEQYNVSIQILDWGHVVANMGMAEHVILNQLRVEQWDIFIGILWTRFGSPTGNKDNDTGLPFNSGTEEEFKSGYRAWKATGRPHILFYRRSTSPISLDDIDPDQYAKVRVFFDKFKPETGNPGLFTSYGLPSEFESRVRQDLTKILPGISKRRQTQNPPPETTAQFTAAAKSPNILADVQQEIGSVRQDVEKSYSSIFQTLNDETREGPSLFSLTPIDRAVFNPKEWISYKLRLTLWCEHSRLPLPVVDGMDSRKGVYEIEFNREWFKKAAPYLRYTLYLYPLLIILGFSCVLITLDETVLKIILYQLIGVGVLASFIAFYSARVIDAAIHRNAKIGDWIDNMSLINDEAIYAKGAALRELHAFLKARDPGFGGLVRVLNKQQKYLWVHERYANEY